MSRTVTLTFTLNYDLDELEEHYDRTFTDEELSEMANDDYLSAGGGEWMVEHEEDNPTTATCRHCQRSIVFTEHDGWVDPEATGDDSIWRETCQDNHENRVAAHEPEGVER